MEYIYIFRTFGRNCSHLKFGYTAESWHRFDQYRNHNPHIEIIYIAQLENAKSLEIEFHNKHNATFGREWYEEDLLDTMLNFINSFDHVNCTNDNKAKNPKPNLKETVIEMQKGNNDVIIAAYKKYPFLEEAIKTMGYEGIEKCGYQSTNIKRKLIQSSAVGQKSKIIQLLKTQSSLHEGSFVSANSLKNILDNVYKSVGITTTAKASDIDQYYHVRTKTPRINNKPVAGFVIIKEKI